MCLLQDLSPLFKSKHVQGLEIHNAHKSLNRSKVMETVDAARKAIQSSGGGPLFLALPAHPELLAKYYDLRLLVKKIDFMMVETHALGIVKKMTYHPSRLSGLWDMMNTVSLLHCLQFVFTSYNLTISLIWCPDANVLYGKIGLSMTKRQ